MPSRNTVKEFGEQQYYHVYNRGVEKRDIFLDDQDYTVFLGLLKKYLSGEKPIETVTSNRHIFTNLAEEVRLLSFCLMPNHFHLLLYQESSDGISKLMRRVATGYVMYFNDRYERVGSLFQGCYKASRISSDSYLHHISRYIHLNPEDYVTSKYSSLKYYVRPDTAPKWLNVGEILSLFDDSPQQYAEFVDDYVMNDQEVGWLLRQLADK